MKQAVVLVSFGTSVEEARRRDIAPVEQALGDCTRLPCRRAYTSPSIRRILARRGVQVQSLAEVLDVLAGEAEEVFIQPTHLLYGNEYDGMKRIVEQKQNLFGRIHLGKPLLANAEDIQALAKIVSDLSPRREGNAYVLMGHGTEHFANMSYPAMQTAFRLIGREDILVGTVEGWPGLEEVADQLKMRSVGTVTLSPLMLVAGDHALNDMAGDGPDSWKSRLEREGLKVDCQIQGLGSLAAVRELYKAHFQELLGNL